MATYTKVKLSGSTDGMGVLVAATATAGTTIHTADATALDEIWLWAQNNDTVSRNLTIEFGDATAPAHNIIQGLATQAGLVLVVAGLLLTNSKTVKAFSDAANKVTLVGYVNRIS